MVFKWLVLASFFLIIELFNPGLFLFLSFSFGSLVAFLSSLLFPQVGFQILSFFGASGFAFVCLVSWLKKENQRVVKTNVYALQGKKAIVTKTIQPNVFGEVKFDGQIWSARAAHNQTILSGITVSIVRVSGAHVVVLPNNSSD